MHRFSRRGVKFLARIKMSREGREVGEGNGQRKMEIQPANFCEQKVFREIKSRITRCPISVKSLTQNVWQIYPPGCFEQASSTRRQQNTDEFWQTVIERFNSYPAIL
jgi:hypothetical protein